MPKYVVDTWYRPFQAWTAETAGNFDPPRDEDNQADPVRWFREVVTARNASEAKRKAASRRREHHHVEKRIYTHNIEGQSAYLYPGIRS